MDTWINIDSKNGSKLDNDTEVNIDSKFGIESPILDSHILLMGKECKFQFLDLDSTLEPKRTLEPKVDFPT